MYTLRNLLPKSRRQNLVATINPRLRVFSRHTTIIWDFALELLPGSFFASTGLLTF